MRYNGDTGKVRAALNASGLMLGSCKPVPYGAEAMVFSDKHVDGTRRLKVWHSNMIVYAEVDIQKRVADKLKELFGDRIIRMYSIPAASYSYGIRDRGPRSLCIELKD